MVAVTPVLGPAAGKGASQQMPYAVLLLPVQHEMCIISSSSHLFKQGD